MIKLKRVYETPSKDDSVRILVDRLWPRGLTKKEAKIDLWLKDVAPSDSLRKWFRHDPKKWEEFKKRYFKELDIKTSIIKEILDKVGRQKVTLVYGSKDHLNNNAVAFKEYLESKF